MPIEKESIYIWSVKWDEYLAEKNHLWRLLSSKEKYRSMQFLSSMARNRFIITRGILRILVGKLTKKNPYTIQFRSNAWGKLKVIDTQIPLEFNLSHSQKSVIYAFCFKYAVGIDIEHPRNNCLIDAIVGRHFSKTEQNVLKGLSNIERQFAFFRGWMKKEAIVKALGLGLHIPLSHIEVNLLSDTPQIFCFYDTKFLPINLLLCSITVHDTLGTALAIVTKKKHFQIMHVTNSIV